jgi:hypothetical protein
VFPEVLAAARVFIVSLSPGFGSVPLCSLKDRVGEFCKRPWVCQAH